MILGPFWCERDRCWVRFIAENNKVRAEIAHASVDIQANTDWQQTDQDNWECSYEAGHEAVNQTAYALNNDTLYSTTGQINRYTNTIYISQYRQNGWKLYSIRDGINPFPNSYTPSQASPAPYNLLPLTPEQLAEKSQREAEEAERVINEEQRRWRQLQQSDMRHQGLIVFIGQDPIIGEANLEILYNALLTSQLEPRASAYENLEDYLWALKTTIEDNTHSFNNAIITVASRTDFDRDQGFDNDEQFRKALFCFKKSFLFTLLREEARFLSEQFNIPCEILSEEELREEDDVRVLEEQAGVLVHQPHAFFQPFGIDYNDPFERYYQETDLDDHPIIVGDMPDYDEETIEHSVEPSPSDNNLLSNVSMVVLRGFIAACGIAVVAVAFTALYAAVLGNAGLVVASTGVASILLGIGMFTRSAEPDAHVSCNSETAPSLS